MNRNITSLLLACVISLVAPLAALAAPITVPPGLNPGDTYRLVFVTSTKRDGTSTNIDDYNAFVTTAANSVPELAALGTTWNAIASTTSVPAAVNTSTYRWFITPGEPFYRLDGALVANGYRDFWDGTHIAAINREETGAQAQDSSFEKATVWTGTGNPEGYVSTGPLGAGPTRFAGGQSVMGQYNSIDLRWISQGYGTLTSTLGRLYGMSDPITVVPEPSSFVLAAVALALLLWSKPLKKSSIDP